MDQRLLFILTNAVLILNLSLFYHMLTRKWSFIITSALYLATWQAAVLVAPLLRPLTGSRVISVFLLGFLFFIPTMLLFKENWKAKVFTFFIVYAITQYITLSFSFIFQICEFVGATKSIYMSIVYVEIVTLFLVHRHFLNALRSVIEIVQKESAIFVLLPIGACILLMIIRIRGAFDLYSFVITIMATGILLATAHLINFIMRLMNRQHQLENQLSLQLDHYRKLTESVKQSYNDHCDIRKQLAGIGTLLHGQGVTVTQAYLDSMKVQYAETFTPVFCTNKYVDAVVAHYFKIAQESSIKLKIKLSLTEEIGIDFLDLCVIIGNCFENAIEACLEIQDTNERQISIRAKVVHGYVAITLKNSYVNAVQRKNGGFVSSKQSERMGVGLESVHLLVEKYDGNIQITTEQGFFIAAISLAIPTP